MQWASRERLGDDLRDFQSALRDCFRTEVHTVQDREGVQLACRLRGRGSLRRRLANRDRGKMFAARVARQRGSPVSTRPQSHVIDPSVATWPQE